MACSEVTVRHLATHAAGLPDFAESFLQHWRGTALRTWRELAPGLAGIEPAFAPGAPVVSAAARRSMTEVPEGQSVESCPAERLTIVLLCNRGYVDMGQLRDEAARLTWAALEQDDR